MTAPDPIAALRKLTENAEAMVKILRDTGRVSACFELAGLAQAQQALQLLDAIEHPLAIWRRPLGPLEFDARAYTRYSEHQRKYMRIGWNAAIAAANEFQASGSAEQRTL
jgi:hypothetical protein